MLVGVAVLMVFPRGEMLTGRVGSRRANAFGTRPAPGPDLPATGLTTFGTALLVSVPLFFVGLFVLG